MIRSKMPDNVENSSLQAATNTEQAMEQDDMAASSVVEEDEEHEKQEEKRQEEVDDEEDEEKTESEIARQTSSRCKSIFIEQRYSSVRKSGSKGDRGKGERRFHVDRFVR